MKIAVFGAGLQARGVIFDLLKQPDISEIRIVDNSVTNLDYIFDKYKDPRIYISQFDIKDLSETSEFLNNIKAAISTVPYQYNEFLTNISINEGCSFCDLGGNNSIVEAQLALDDKAKKANITTIPDCGLAPGLPSILVKHALADFDTIDTVEIRVGGLPQKRGGLLDYTLSFSINGLINEYIEDATILENYNIKTVPSLSAVEPINDFPEPFKHLEAFTTSGGISTLPDTYKNKINNINDKTIRYKGHCNIINIFKDLGLLSSEPIMVSMDYASTMVSPRKVFEIVAEKALNTNNPDVILFRVNIIGKLEGKNVTRKYQMIEYGSPDLSAMIRCTAFPASIVLLMLARNQIKEKGVLPQEKCIDTEIFMKELHKRNIKLNYKDL